VGLGFEKKTGLNIRAVWRIMKIAHACGRRPDMLCEQCQEREATVHSTVVLSPTAEVTRHDYCDSCYPAVEAERAKTCNSQPNSPLPADVEHITALEYLAACARAACNGVDKPALKHIHEELKRLPKTRQRLTFEMLRLAWQTLERREDPGWETGFPSCAWGSIEAEQMPEYIMWLEKIAIRCFELRGQLPSPQGEHGPFTVSLNGMLIALGKVDRARFSVVLGALKSKCDEADLNSRRKLLSGVEGFFLKSRHQEPGGQ